MSISFECISEEVIVNCYHWILFLILEYRCIYGKQLLLDQVQLICPMKQRCDNECGKRVLTLAFHIRLHQILNLFANHVITKHLSLLNDLLFVQFVGESPRLDGLQEIVLILDLLFFLMEQYLLQRHAQPVARCYSLRWCARYSLWSC